MITIKFNDIIQFIEIYFLLLFVNVIGFNVQLNRCELKFCINGIVLILTANKRCKKYLTSKSIPRVSRPHF